MGSEVVPGVIQQRLAHSKVLYLSDENLLVDTGPETEWSALQSFIDEQGPVDAVFVSHAHGDHTGNATQVLKEYEPGVVYYPENEPLSEVELDDADITRISDGETLSDDLEVVEVSGHTEGICALYLPERETLLATDVLDGSDRRGLPPGYLLPPPAAYNWDTQQAETNIEMLLSLSFDTVVVTHGSNVTDDVRLKLDRYLNFADHYRKELLESLSYTDG